MTEETRKRFLEAKTEEEAKAIFESIQGELDDDDLELISGGRNPWTALWEGAKKFGEKIGETIVQIGTGIGETVAGCAAMVPAGIIQPFAPEAAKPLHDWGLSKMEKGIDDLGIH